MQLPINRNCMWRNVLKDIMGMQSVKSRMWKLYKHFRFYSTKEDGNKKRESER